MTFEKRTPEYETVESETDAPGYLDLARPLLPAVLVAIVSLALIASGIVSLPAGLLSTHPTVSDAPGHADQVSDLDLPTIEQAVLTKINDRRKATGREPLRKDTTLQRIATFENQQRVVSQYPGGSVSGSAKEFNSPCRGSITLLVNTASPSVTVESFEDESSLAETIVSGMFALPAWEETALSADGSAGVDVHVGPDGRVFVVQAYC